jgi:hypothetical protein
MSARIKIGTMVRIVRLIETDKTPGGRAGKPFAVFVHPDQPRYPQSAWPREEARHLDDQIRVNVGVDDDGLSSTHHIEFRNPS